MKLQFIGHDEKYAVEQSLLTLFPDERPVYGTVDRAADRCWAVVTLTEDGSAVRAVTELCAGGKTAAGSVTLRIADTLFVGDTLFAGSCGRTDLPGGDPRAMMSSLRRLGLLEGDYKVCPGHMDSTVLSRERTHNMFLRAAIS